MINFNISTYRRRKQEKNVLSFSIAIKVRCISFLAYGRNSIHFTFLVSFLQELIKNLANQSLSGYKKSS